MPLLTLSDGRTVRMDPGASKQDWENAQNAGEAQIAAEYGAQAAKQNAPVVDRNGTYVYSATNRYGNNWFGHAGAWADHNIPGMMAAERWLHSAGLDAPVGQPGGGAAGMIGRIGTMAGTYGAPVVGQSAALYDLGASAYNALKTAAGVQGYEAPTILGGVQRGLGVQGMDPNASGVQQVVEAIAGGAPSARSLMGAIVRPTASVVAGNVGENIGESIDPRFGRLGALAGAVSPAGVEAGASRVPGIVASPNAARTAASLQALGLPGSFTALANPTGKMGAKSVSGLWGVGSPIRGANEELEKGLLSKQKEAADNIAMQAGGGRIVPAEGRLGMGEGEIGRQLINGAQQASVNTRRMLETEQQDFADRLQPGHSITEVPVTPIRQALEAYRDNPKNGVTDTMWNLIEPHLQAMERQTIGGGSNQAQTWGVQGQDTLPWDVMRNQRRQINEALSSYQPGQATPDARLLGALDNAITSSMMGAADGVAPGMGAEFQRISTNYAHNYRNVLPQFDRVGGKPITDPYGATTWSGGMIPGQAYNELMSPLKQEGVTPFITLASENPNFPRDNWARAAGGVVSKLGEGENGSYRSDAAAKQWNQLDTTVKDAITMGPNQMPLPEADTLRHIANVGSETVLPPQRHGLTAHAGAFGSMMFAADVVSDLMHHALDPVNTALAGGAGLAAGYGAARAVESQGFKNAMSGGSTSLTDALYNSIPSAAITMGQLYGNDPGAPTPPTPMQAPPAAQTAAPASMNPNPQQ